MKDVEIYVSPRNEEKSKHLAEIYSNVIRMDSNQLVLENAEIIFIALIPNQAEKILEQLGFREDHIIVSLIPYAKLSLLTEVLHPARTISTYSGMITMWAGIIRTAITDTNISLFMMYRCRAKV